MSARLRIFNVTGIMLNGRVDAISEWLQRELAPAQIDNRGAAAALAIDTFAPIPASRVLDPPSLAIARTGERMDAFLAAAAAQDPEACLLGIGRSFGGYLLLKAASERPARLAGFTRLVAIEAPLAPEVAVGIPALLPVLLPSLTHYRERPHHAAAMLRALAGCDRTKLVTMGSPVDGVIPPAAQRLPGLPALQHHGANLTAVAQAVAAGGVHVELPAFAPGFTMETALLPSSYRVHLSWSEAKHRLINQLIRAASAVPEPTKTGAR